MDAELGSKFLELGGEHKLDQEPVIQVIPVAGPPAAALTQAPIAAQWQSTTPFKWHHDLRWFLSGDGLIKLHSTAGGKHVSQARHMRRKLGNAHPRAMFIDTR